MNTHGLDPSDALHSRGPLRGSFEWLGKPDGCPVFFAKRAELADSKRVANIVGKDNSVVCLPFGFREADYTLQVRITHSPGGASWWSCCPNCRRAASRAVGL